ncbi:MAG: YbaB/EbfC family nucleoid-associated protein, partial [Treponema sp.]|nr:YbaB/EbfC family nucleoid-associated protein [Treponema sp.]
MNPFELVKNLGNMKEQLQNMQNQIASIEATGSSGGNMVSVTLNGKFEIV